MQDPTRIEVIRLLRAKARENQSRLWQKVAEELDRVRKNRRAVNIHKISKYTRDGDVVVIPGKVLGDGIISHKVNVAAFRFTDGAAKKITDAGGSTMQLIELAEDNPKGSNIKIMG